MLFGATCIFLATVFFFWNLPVEHYHPSGHDYVFRHYEFAWIALSLFSLWMLLVWSGSPKMRELVRWDLENATAFKELLARKVVMEVPAPSAEELDVWSGCYRGKKPVQKEFVERRKQA
jgi:glutamate/tyrosine decarboxylase-like PLP-dependent enzyme